MKQNFLSFLFLFFLNISHARTPETVKILIDDGWQLNAKWLKPVGENKVFVLIHSQKKNNTEWKKWYPEISRYGYGYLALDLRGHGLSIIDPEGSTTTYKSFSIEGLNNEYNKMIRDIDAAIIWLSSNSITEDRLVLVGSWLGANLAVKYSVINKNIPLVVAIFPSLNINDVRIVEPLRAYGQRPILLVVGYKFNKKYIEFQIANGLVKNSAGINKTLSLVEDIKDASTFNLSSIRKVIEWVQNPYLPDVLDYTVDFSTYNINYSTQPENIDDFNLNDEIENE